MDLAINNLQRLICHKTKQTKQNQTISDHLSTSTCFYLPIFLTRHLSGSFFYLPIFLPPHLFIYPSLWYLLFLSPHLFTAASFSLTIFLTHHLSGFFFIYLPMFLSPDISTSPCFPSPHLSTLPSFWFLLFLPPHVSLSPSPFFPSPQHVSTSPSF